MAETDELCTGCGRRMASKKDSETRPVPPNLCWSGWFTHPDGHDTDCREADYLRRIRERS